jgi:hypothetical protein
MLDEIGWVTAIAVGLVIVLVIVSVKQGNQEQAQKIELLSQARSFNDTLNVEKLFEQKRLTRAAELAAIGILTK